MTNYEEYFAEGVGSCHRSLMLKESEGVLPKGYCSMSTVQWVLLKYSMGTTHAFLNICQSSNKNPFHRCRVTLTQTLLIQVYISFTYLPFFFESLFTKDVQQTISIHIYLNHCNTGAPTSLHQLKETDPDLHSFLARFHIIPCHLLSSPIIPLNSTSLRNLHVMHRFFGNSPWSRTCPWNSKERNSAFGQKKNYLWKI